MIQNQSIICFAGEDWWYHHPHSKNHLMKRFVRQNRVMFINSISMGLPSVRSRDFFAKVRRKLKSYLKFVRRTPEGIWVVTPIVLPFFSSALGRNINLALLQFQIRFLAWILGFRTPVLWVAIPTARDMVGRLNESALIYQVSDKYDANTMDHGDRSALIRKLHADLIEAADVVYYSGRKLLADATVGLEKSRLLEQAVDFEHYASTTSKTWDCPPELKEIKAKGKPILGYFGAIETWLIDQDLIRYVTERHPDWQFVFIGLKTSPLDIESLPNVHCISSQPYANLPAFAGQFDVCVLPWVTNNEFVNYGSAIKVREYLATGKPVVITPLYEYEPLDGILRIVRSYDHFIECIESVLAADSPESRQARQQAVMGSTWDVRAEQVSEVIENILKQKKI
ncbi:MAG TPA: glycosyltransferase [Acidobacteriota bacterium]|nr:glycosyltransferase [Acidobacteriota bacterium]